MMKRLSINLIAALLLAVSTTGALAAVGSGNMWGIQGGLNFGSVATTPANTFTSRTGFAVGLLADFEIAEGIFISPQLQYLQMGAANGTAVLALDYLQLPIDIEGKFGSPEIKAVVFAGPDIGLALNRTNNGIDVSAQYGSIDFGIHFGAGVECKVADKAHVFLTGRYLLGLNALDSIQTTKANGLLVLTGVKFGM